MKWIISPNPWTDQITFVFRQTFDFFTVDDMNAIGILFPDMVQFKNGSLLLWLVSCQMSGVTRILPGKLGEFFFLPIDRRFGKRTILGLSRLRSDDLPCKNRPFSNLYSCYMVNICKSSLSIIPNQMSIPPRFEISWTTMLLTFETTKMWHDIFV